MILNPISGAKATGYGLLTALTRKTDPVEQRQSLGKQAALGVALGTTIASPTTALNVVKLAAKNPGSSLIIGGIGLVGFGAATQEPSSVVKAGSKVKEFGQKVVDKLIGAGEDLPKLASGEMSYMDYAKENKEVLLGAGGLMTLAAAKKVGSGYVSYLFGKGLGAGEESNKLPEGFGVPRDMPQSSTIPAGSPETRQEIPDKKKKNKDQDSPLPSSDVVASPQDQPMTAPVPSSEVGYPATSSRGTTGRKRGKNKPMNISQNVRLAFDFSRNNRKVYINRALIAH